MTRLSSPQTHNNATLNDRLNFISHHAPRHVKNIWANHSKKEMLQQYINASGPSTSLFSFSSPTRSLQSTKVSTFGFIFVQMLLKCCSFLVVNATKAVMYYD